MNASSPSSANHKGASPAPILRSILAAILAALLLLTFFTLLILFFQHLPIQDTSLGLDWKGLWVGLGRIEYGNATGLRIPPWSVLVLWPLGQLDFRTSWAILAGLTLIVLLLAAPTPRLAPLLMLSYPALRTIADGNLELLVIAGLLLLRLGLKKQNAPVLIAGLLLASSKPQETWLLFLFLPLILYRSVPRRTLLATGLGLILVVLPALAWKGREWITGMLSIQERGSIMDSSLWARLPFPCALPVALVVLAGTLITWKKTSLPLLVAASMLLAPYTAGNSFLSLYAIAPLDPFTILLANLPYLSIGHNELTYSYGPLYWTVAMLLVWIRSLLTPGSSPSARPSSSASPPPPDQATPHTRTHTTRPRGSSCPCRT